MRQFDVFNGDADGLTSLVQLRLHEPRTSELVTGVKRDIELVARVDAQAGDAVTVLDVSLDSNRAALARVLAAGATVDYFDHHFAGELPVHAGLRAHIDTSPEVCTACLVNAHLGGAFIAWAIVGAFGDNLTRTATGMARAAGLSPADSARLERLGTVLNYNGYGPSEADLHFAPAALFRHLVAHASPFAFLAGEPEIFARLDAGYGDDLRRGLTLAPVRANASWAVLVLPDEAWARRVSGVLGNDLANAHPDRAHALLTPLPEGGYVVSVRAPLARRVGADALCRQFPTGGGRAAAAGINRLPEDQVDAFCAAFAHQFDT